jgi:hypothetical protein
VRDVRALLAATALALLLPLLPSGAASATTAADAQDRPRPTSGTIFWANAWAAHHTAARRGMTGAERMHRLVRLVDSTGASLGVLAEVERPQIAAFRRATHSYRLAVAGRGTTDGVFWDDERYELVASRRFRGLTYGGRRTPVPVVVLRDRSTDHLLGVMAVHNPRDRWRDRALRRELREVRALRHQYGDGITVLVAGDFNSGEPVACRAHRARLYSAGHRRCGWAPIDQLLVDRHVRIRGYRAMRGPRVGRITDHPAVYRARFTAGPTRS